MARNLKKLAKLINEVKEERAKRSYMRLDEDVEGPLTWLINVSGVVYKVTQDDKELIIIEGDVLDTDDESMETGDEVVHMLAMSGVQPFIKTRNLGHVKTMMRLHLGLKDEPTEDEWADLLDKALPEDDGEGDDPIPASSLVGMKLKVMASRQTSQSGNSYIKYNLSAATEAEFARLSKKKGAVAVSVANLPAEELDAPTTKNEDKESVSEIDLGDDEDPPF